MSYTPILYGLLIFIVSMVVHIVYWRFFPTRKALLVPLLVAFAVVPAVAVLLFYFIIAPALGFFAIGGGSATTTILSFCLHLALSFAYIMTYPAIQARCPTLSMLLVIGREMPEGAKLEQLASTFDVEDFLDPRIRDLFDSELIEESDGAYRTTRKGQNMLKPFLILRALLGLPTGKG